MRIYLKKSIVLTAIAVLLLGCIYIHATERLQLQAAYNQGNELPLEEVKAFALKEARNLWGVVAAGPVIPYCDVRGNILAYAMVYGLSVGEIPTDEEIFAGIRLTMETGDAGPAGFSPTERREWSRKRWGIDQYATLVVGAREDVLPVLEYHTGLPPYFTRLHQARVKAAEQLNVKPSDLSLNQIVATGFMDKWFKFVVGEQRILVNLYSLETESVATLDSLAASERTDLRLRDAETVRRIREQYAEPRNADANAVLPGSGNVEVESNHIPGVPFYLNYRGSASTAAAMVLGYWDTHGYDTLMAGTDPAPLIDELADAIGPASYSDVADGIEYVANTLRGFTFSAHPTSVRNYTGNSGSITHYNTVKTEINAGRPLIWHLWDYRVPSGQPYGGSRVNHVVTVDGYKLVKNSLFPYDFPPNYVYYYYARVHTTWDSQTRYWGMLQKYDSTGSYYYCDDYSDILVKVIPGAHVIPPAPVVTYRLESASSGPIRVNGRVSIHEAEHYYPKMSWEPVDGAVRYEIRRGYAWGPGFQNNPNLSQVAVVSGTSFTDDVFVDTFYHNPPADYDVLGLFYAVVSVDEYGCRSVRSNLGCFKPTQ